MTALVLWWTLTIVLMLVGLVGSVLPLLPGTVLILGAAVIHRIALGPEKSVGWITLVGLTALMVLAHLVDLVSGSIGAKWFGATRWGAVGAILGAIVGLFFMPIGIFVGPLVGVLLFELLGGKEILPAGRATWGALLGTTAGIAMKFAIASTMIVWFLIAALF
jgi:uncharacterized protein